MTRTMPLLNRAKLRVGEVTTDGRTVSLRVGDQTGPAALSFTAAAVNALGAMPPLLEADWRIGIGRALAAHGYSVHRDRLADAPQ